MIDRCVACGSGSWAPGETWLEYQLAVCHRCGVTFTRNPDYTVQRYVAAYAGGATDPVVPEEHGYVYEVQARRLELETLALIAPPPRLTPAQRLSLRWLGRHAPRGAVVIDCGCGSGLFLRALRNAGVRGVGVEVTRDLVQLLVARGLEAIQGEVPDFPWMEGRPFALTLFDVLEHFADPAWFIGHLAERFPGTAILASVPSPTRANLFLHGVRGLSDHPPNHFVRWTPKALEMFFARQGYRQVTVHVPGPSGSELLPGAGQLLARFRSPADAAAVRPSSRRQGAHPVPAGRATLRVPAAGKRILITAFLWLHKCFQVAEDFLGALPALRARSRGASASSMLVIAE